MRFDRIVTDLVRFINTLLWWRKGLTDAPPYTKIGMPIRGEQGVLQEIQRNFPAGAPNREISYWIFWERRESGKKTSRDIHIVCAFLGAIKGGKSQVQTRTQPRSTAPTHRIEIMQASHWVRKDGTWDCEQIHSGDYDLQGSHSLPHSFAPLIIKKIAVQLLMFKVEEINWEFEIESSRKEVMKAHYTPQRPRSNTRLTIEITHHQARLTDDRD